MNTFQTTIAKEISFTGVGLHTGLKTNVTLKPNKADAGIVFYRTDTNSTIKAIVNNVNRTIRSTTIGSKNESIQTIEHLMAAISSQRISNLLIEVDGPEIPIFDGSAKPFVQALQTAGIENQNKPSKIFEIKKKLTFTNEETNSKFTITPSDKFELDVTIDFNSNVLKTQNAILNELDNFKNEISNARTFCFLHELEHLLDNNLIKGGDLNNAIVYVEKPISNQKLTYLSKAFNKTGIEVNENGVLNNIELHYDNEAAKHKLLDLIGDLSLIGMPIKGKITAERPGHTANIEFAKFLHKIIVQEERITPPKINEFKKPIYTKSEIENILPHRDPFLLIDNIYELSAERVIGIKYVNENEYYFKGHFPNNPIMPGVLQIEAMAQVGGILALSTVPDPENYLTYFLKIDNARFKQKVVPNDTIIFKLDLIAPIKRGLCQMEGRGFVKNKLACEATLLAQIVKEY